MYGSVNSCDDSWVIAVVYLTFFFLFHFQLFTIETRNQLFYFVLCCKKRQIRGREWSGHGHGELSSHFVDEWMLEGAVCFSPQPFVSALQKEINRDLCVFCSMPWICLFWITCLPGWNVVMTMHRRWTWNFYVKKETLKKQQSNIKNVKLCTTGGSLFTLQDPSLAHVQLL